MKFTLPSSFLAAIGFATLLSGTRALPDCGGLPRYQHLGHAQGLPYNPGSSTPPQIRVFGSNGPSVRVSSIDAGSCKIAALFPDADGCHAFAVTVSGKDFYLSFIINEDDRDGCETTFNFPANRVGGARYLGDCT